MNISIKFLLIMSVIIVETNLCVAINFSNAASSDSIPPNFPLEVAPRPTLKTAPASSVVLGSVPVLFDHTTLGKLLRQTKVGKINHKEDASESVYWLCYSITSPASRETIWFLSNEPGPSDHVIYGIAAKVSFFSSSAADCPELPETLRPIKLDNNIWLGTRASDIKKKLGKPSLQRGEWLHYASVKKLRGDPRAKEFGTDVMYETGSLSVLVRAGKVVVLWATKSVD